MKINDTMLENEVWKFVQPKDMSEGYVLENKGFWTSEKENKVRLWIMESWMTQEEKI